MSAGAAEPPDDLHDALLALYNVIENEVGPLDGPEGYTMYTHEDDQKVWDAADRITNLLYSTAPHAEQ